MLLSSPRRPNGVSWASKSHGYREGWKNKKYLQALVAIWALKTRLLYNDCLQFSLFSLVSSSSFQYDLLD